MGAKAIVEGSPAPGDFYAQHRGGGLLTEAFNQRVGSLLALAAFRLGMPPSVVTVLGLVVGLTGSVLMLTGGAAGALAGLLAWHLAYSLDCADGQLARVTGKASPAGGRLDVLCDIAVQIGVVTAVGAIAARSSPETARWLAPMFAGAWLINLFTSVLAGGPGSASLLPSGGVVRVVKLIRDYAALITSCGLVIWLRPEWTVWLMGALSLVNGGFLALSIVQALRRSLAT
ncbi:MAG TPA: CDP-alcohol phosphatidyltransferase family protein [Candidatus Limnocylindrales bacterium]|nr:CDP-alcohol phosphatidyltransferase family protein [Candidatus Limnocylindrales bacterium]